MKQSDFPLIPAGLRWSRLAHLGRPFLLCLITLTAAFGLEWAPRIASNAANGASSSAKHARAGLSEHVTISTTGGVRPAFNLTDGREVTAAYRGEPALRELLAQNQAAPLSLTSGDFDEDGVADLVAGYAGPDGGGVVALHRGNVDAIHPNTPEAEQRRERGEYSDAPFLSDAGAFSLPSAPDLIGAGDFDADGHQDIVAAKRGGATLWFMPGDGHGGFGSVRKVELPGAVTTMIVGDINRADGLADVIVGIHTENGPRVLVFESPRGAANARAEIFSLPAEATALALGQFVGEQETDLAVAAGNQLLLIRGRDRKLSLDVRGRDKVPPALIDQYAMDFGIAALAVGDFGSKSQRDLAMMGDDGTVHVWQNLNFANTGNATIRRIRSEGPFAQQGSNLLNLNWRESRTISLPNTAKAAAGSRPQLIAAHISGRSLDDLVVVNPGNRQLRLVPVATAETEYNRESAAANTADSQLFPDPVTLPVDSLPIAALPMRLNQAALSSLVLLRDGSSAPTVIPAAPNSIITVNSNADTNVRDNVLTLREAIMLANGDLLKSSLTAAEQAQVQGTPAPGLDQINFNIPVSQSSIDPPVGEHTSATSSLASNQMVNPIATLIGNNTRRNSSSVPLGTFACNTPSYELTNFQLNLDGPASMIAGDYTGDGLTDILVVGGSGGTGFTYPVALLAGQGASGLALPMGQSLGIGSNFNHIRASASADFNGDGNLDLITSEGGDPCCPSSNQVAFGNGKGGFTTGPSISTTDFASAIAIGDLDGDGHPDIIFGINGNNIAVVLNKGNGVFGTATNFQTLETPAAIAVADFNGDGKLDLALVNRNNNSVSILLGNGTGGFASPTSFPVGAGPNSIVVGDFNSDGKLDLAIVNGTDGTVTVLRGNGNGGFGTLVNFAVGSNPNSIAIADFNNDGKSDLAVANGSSNTISVLRGNGIGGFSPAVSYPVGVGPAFILAKDLNGDSQLDLAVVNTASPNTVTVLKGDGAGNFSRSPSFPVGSSPAGIAVGDFNGDNKLDLAVSNFSANTVSILLGNGSGGFGAQTTVTAGTSPAGIGIGDFNGDGKQDLAVVNVGNGNVSILLGNGSGGFGAATNFAVGSISHGDVVVRDFNGDGKLDLAVQNGNNVAILLGNGSGGFGAPTNFPIGSTPAAIGVGDFNGDGKLDLAVATTGGNIAILLGNGNGTFGVITNFSTGTNGSNSISVGDFDGDNVLDLAVLGGGTVSVLFGNGNGAFSVPTKIAVGAGCNFLDTIAAVDFNGDGLLDLVATNPCTNSVSILVNVGGGFATLPGIQAGNRPGKFSIGDFNGDGKPDLVVANNVSNDVSLILNTCAIAPDLSLKKTHTGNFTVGVNGTYNFVIANNSVGPTTGPITVIDTLPAGLCFISSAGAGWSCSATGSAVTCSNPGPLAPRTSSNFSISVAVSAQAVPRVTNTATVATATETNTSDNTATDLTNVLQTCVPTPITVGQTVNASLATTDCLSSIRGTNDTFAHRYSFTGAANQQVAISLTSTAFDAFLYLIGPNGNVLVADDDGGGGSNSRIPAVAGFFTLPSAGTYTIEATSFGPGRTGAYTLMLTTGSTNCTYTLTPNAASFGGAAGTGTVTVNTPAGCSWGASSNAGFINITAGSTGTGNGTVSYSVGPNLGSVTRTGTIIIAGQTFTVTQASGAACTFALTPSSSSFTAASATGSITVNSPSGCAYSASSGANFINITSGANGSGAGTISFSVAANPGLNARSGTITLAGLTVTISQGGTIDSVRTIALTSPLPKITDAVIIDGTTQLPGSTIPLIEIDGSALRDKGGGNGLTVTGGGSTIRGLVLNGFSSPSRDAGILLITNGNNVIQNCYFGTDVTGTSSRTLASGATAVSSGLAIRSSSNNQIGGATAAARNVLSGNDGSGITVSGGATGNSIQGNFIGPDVTGSISLGFQQNGIVIQGASGNRIGGTNAREGNIISGNIDYGIYLQDDSHNNTIQGNRIGTNATGTVALPNGNAGIFIYNSLISQLNSAGFVSQATTDNTVGGTSPTASNLISGNDPYGVVLSAGVSGTLIQGNLIGTDVTGTVALANTYGVTVTQAAGSVIGGDPIAAPGARNVISANRLAGVSIGFLSNGQTGGTGTTLLGNYIGVDTGGTANLGNGGDGVFVNVNSSSHFINSNLIAFNGGNGILIPNTSPDGSNSAVQIDLHGNILTSNTKLGVDLGGDASADGDGPTPNTPGVHTSGANLLQNRPVLQASNLGAFASGDSAIAESSNPSALGLTVSGTYQSAPNQTFDLQFYYGGSCQNAGSGNNQSGQFIGVISIPPILLGTRQVMTDSSGNAAYNFVFPYTGSVSSGFVNAQATSSVGNSSEISTCQQVQTGTLAAPTITGFTPSGVIGSQVTITGNNLLDATVKFTGTTIAAQVISNSNTQLVVVVPLGATTGPITITTAGGQATSAGNFGVGTAPLIIWSNPADIVFGTPLGNTQLNATASNSGALVPGAFSYAPPAGTILNAGQAQTISATFTPQDQITFVPVTKAVQISVIRATPTVNVTGGTFIFDGAPHPATGSVLGVNSANLGAPTFTYNGSSSAPVNPGSYTVVGTFAGNNNYNAASNTAVIIINQTPSITSSTNTTFTVGTTGSFTVVATGTPAPTLSETGTLPGGVSFNPVGGILGGTPAAGTGGVYSVTFTASNGVGSNAVQTFTLTINQAPALTSASSAGFTVGKASGFTVTATGFPAPTLSETGSLPTGITFNPTSGVLGGTPAAGAAGNYSIMFKASNGVGTIASQGFSLTIDSGLLPATLTLGNLSQTYDGAPKSVTVTTAPPGLSGTSVTYNGATTPPTNAGSYTVIASLNNITFQASSVTDTLVIAKASQIITFLAIGNHFVTDPALTLTASASSCLAITYSGTGPISLSGNSITFTGTGSASVTAMQAGDSNNNPATPVTINFSITNALPQISSLSPGFVTPGSGAFLLTVNGNGFVSGSVVNWNASARQTSFVSATKLTAQITAVDVAQAGQGSVTVVSPAPGGGTAAAQTVTIATVRSGDLNGDGVIDASDLVLLANVLAGNVTLSSTATTAADVFQDGVINAADLVTLANYLAGNITALPVVPRTTQSKVESSIDRWEADFSLTYTLDWYPSIALD